MRGTREAKRGTQEEHERHTRRTREEHKRHTRRPSLALFRPFILKEGIATNDTSFQADVSDCTALDRTPAHIHSCWLYKSKCKACLSCTCMNHSQQPITDHFWQWATTNHHCSQQLITDHFCLKKTNHYLPLFPTTDHHHSQQLLITTGPNYPSLITAIPNHWSPLVWTTSHWSQFVPTTNHLSPSAPTTNQKSTLVPIRNDWFSPVQTPKYWSQFTQWPLTDHDSHPPEKLFSSC